MHYYLEGISIVSYLVFNACLLKTIGICNSSLGLSLGYISHIQNPIEITKTQNNLHYVNMDPWASEDRNDADHELLAIKFNGLEKH